MDRHLDIGADGLPNYKVGLSAQRLHGELAVCCDLLVRTLALLSDVCKLELKQLIDDLLPEYKAVFGGDSLEELVDDD